MNASILTRIKQRVFGRANDDESQRLDDWLHRDGGMPRSYVTLGSVFFPQRTWARVERIKLGDDNRFYWEEGDPSQCTLTGEWTYGMEKITECSTQSSPPKPYLSSIGTFNASILGSEY